MMRMVIAGFYDSSGYILITVRLISIEWKMFYIKHNSISSNNQLSIVLLQPDGDVEGLQARLQDAERALRQAKDRASQVSNIK